MILFSRRMRGSVKRSSYALAIALFPLLAVQPSRADTSSGYLVDHGVAVYYAVIPAEMIKGHPKGHAEAAMHGGVPGNPHGHHVMVALFDVSKNLERIVGADVTAKVAEIGLAGEEKGLEPFKVAGALTYGNYFDFRPHAEYRIGVNVKAPGFKDAAHVEFEFKHE